MNKKIRIIFFLASLCSLWLISCTPKVPDEAEIVIISFNDLHGDFENLPQLSAFLQETRATYENVIVVDAGDRFTGNPFNDFHEKKQFPIVDLLRDIGIDVWLIGNHEFDYGVELLNERIQESNSVVISANKEFQNSGLIGVKPYHIIDKNGIKIAFLGLTNVEKQTGMPATLKEHIAHIQFFDPVEAALPYKFLRNKSHIFAALTHIGISEDIILADSMPELDLIVGGHSHTLIIDSMLFRNGVLITQAGYQARHVGKTKIKLKKGVVSEISNEKISLRDWNGPVDSVLLRKIEAYKDSPFLKEPFTTLKYKIPTHQQLGHMMTDAALKLANVDFSVMNCGGIRIQSLPAGSITYGDILRLSPFNNYLVIVELKPAEIRTIIEMEFLERRNCLMIPAGFEYTAKRIGTELKVGKMTHPNGKILDENKTYRVALNNYILTTYLPEHLEKADDTEIFLVDNIVAYLQNNPNVDYRNVRARARLN